MEKIDVNKIKTGELYFFPDTDFYWSDLFKTTISKEKIYRIVGGDFSTKNDGDRYEVIRHIGFETKEEAKEHLIKEIKSRKKLIDAECLKAIKQLTTSSVN